MKNLFLSSLAVLLIATPAMAEDSPAAKAEDGKGHNKYMESIDADGNGAVSKTEFMAFHEKRFAETDTNSDGSIDKAEMVAKKAEWKKKMQERRAKYRAMKADKEKADGTVQKKAE